MAEGFWGDYSGNAGPPSAAGPNDDWREQKRARFEMVPPDDPWHVHAASAIARHNILASSLAQFTLIRDAETNQLQGYLGQRSREVSVLVGAESRFVSAAYNLAIARFMKRQQWRINWHHPLCLNRTGLIAGHSAETPELSFGSLYSLPPDFVRQDDLTIMALDTPVYLPDRLTVDGAVKIFDGMAKVHFGENTQILKGHLAVDYAQATPLPPDLLAPVYGLYNVPNHPRAIVTPDLAGYNNVVKTGRLPTPAKQNWWNSNKPWF